MPSRELRVVLVGDHASLSRSLAGAQRDLNGLHGAGERFRRGFGTAVRAGSVAAAGGVALFAYGAVKAIQSAGDFEQQLNVLQAVSGATGDQMKQISALSIALGKDITLPATSAQDAAVAMTELVKAGLSVSDAMKAAKGTLELAAAGELDAGSAATIAATALNQFHLRGKEAGYVADLLAGAANASAGNVTDFAEALKYAGTSSHAAGQKIALTVGALAEMANAGLQGSIAGSSLAQALRSLQAPSSKASKEMQGLGINIYDAHGKMLPLDQIAQVFTTHLGDLSQQQQNQALATIFGSRAIQAARVVFLGGAGALDKYTLKVSESGSAQRLAAARMKGFRGALQGLQSNVETLGISLGLILIPAAATAARKLSGLVDSISQVTSAKSPRIALHILWMDAGKIYQSLHEALFGGMERAKSTFAGHQGVEIPVHTQGIVDKLGAALAQVDWKTVGIAVGGGIAAGFTFTADSANRLISTMTDALISNSDKIAAAGVILATKLVITLTDPSFWVSHWELAIGLILAIAPTRFLKVGGLLGKVLGKGLLKAADEIFTHLPRGIQANIMVAIGRAAGWGKRLALELVLAGEAVLQRIPGSIQRVFVSGAHLAVQGLQVLWSDIKSEGRKALTAIGEAIDKSLVAKTLKWVLKVTAVLTIFNAIKSAVQWLLDKLGELANKISNLPSLPSIPGGGLIKSVGSILPATGGLVTGGIPGRDSVPALLTPGEIVLNKQQQLSLLRGGGGRHITVKQYFNASPDPRAMQAEAAWNLRRLLPHAAG